MAMPLSDVQKKLMEEGTSGFGLYNMNQLIVFIANEKDMSYIDVTDQTILDYHKELKIDGFNEMCEDVIVEGFVASNGHTYRTNRDDQVNMIGQKDELTANESIQTIMWKTEDVGYVQHTKTEWLAVYSEAFNHKKNQLVKYDTLKKQVLSATRHEDIISVVWE